MFDNFAHKFFKEKINSNIYDKFWNKFYTRICARILISVGTDEKKAIIVLIARFFRLVIETSGVHSSFIPSPSLHHRTERGTHKIIMPDQTEGPLAVIFSAACFSPRPISCPCPKKSIRWVFPAFPSSSIDANDSTGRSNLDLVKYCDSVSTPQHR